MSDNIRVAVRIRPLIDRESKEEIAWDVKGPECVSIESGLKFKFDKVFDKNKTNEDVYIELCQPIVKSVIQGFNGTIFAYGQTSSGKSYTMSGEHGGIHKGVIHYAIEELFDIIQKMQNREFLLRVSFLEIYNEKVYDLLSNKKKDLNLCKDYYNALNVKGLQEKIVPTSEEIWNLMYQAQKNRRTAETQLNINSSRSHFIFRMIVESTQKSEEVSVVNVSQLNLVDLAGSEDVSQAKGVEFKEGVNINKSLRTLAQVIKDLSERKQFINYRDSKLTRLLEHSLGGNAVTAILCTITPVSSAFRESHSTLKFAESAKKIKNKPEKNEILTEQALLKQCANEIKRLTEQLEARKECTKELEEKTRQYEVLKNQIAELKRKFVTQNIETKSKATRRETWGGHLDVSKFLKPSNPYMLPQILEEEPEKDSESTDVFTDSMFRRRSTRSSSSNVTTPFDFTSKQLRNVKTQTDQRDLEKELEEAMALVSDLQSQLKTLGNEFSELSEYTTLERQLLKAENELQVEIKTLKEENSNLKKVLECHSLPEKSQPLSNELDEHNLSANRDFESDDTRCNDEVFAHSNLSKKFNNSLNSQKCASSKKRTETSIFDCTNSTTLLDESLKSNFLAFYDEYVENEALTELKSEIESLKYDIEIKDKQIGLLNDKILIKDQFITSLKDEIALGKNIDSPNKSLSEKIVQVHEICQTDLSSCSPPKNFVHKDSQTSSKSCETSSITYSESNNFRDLNISPLKSKSSSNCYLSSEKSIQTSPKIFAFDVDMKFSTMDAFTETSQSEIFVNDLYAKCTTENQLTQVTPKISREFSTQYCRSEIVDERYVQTSPIKQMASFSEHFKEENSVIDQYTEVTDSFIEENYKSLNVEDKKSNLNVFVDQNRILPEDTSQTINLDMKKISINSLSDEMKILVNKISKLRAYITNFMKNCAKHEYLNTLDIFDLNINDCDSKSSEKEIVDLENLITALEFYIRNIDDECELLNSELVTKSQEIIQLNSKLSKVENSLEAKESELSNLCTMFLDLKQSFSQQSFICEVLSNIDTEDELAELKQLTGTSVSQACYIPDYELTLFKKLFVKLNTHMKDNASKIFNLSEDLKKVSLELSTLEKERELQLCDSLKIVSKNTVSKSVQTSDILETAVKTDKLVLELNNEIKNLKSQNNELRQNNEDLKNKMDDLISSHSDSIDSLSKDFENSKSIWKEKTEALVRDLETKYDRELIDQENKLTEDMDAKILELKEQHLKQVQDLKTSHDRKVSDIKKEYEDKLSSQGSESNNLKKQLEMEKEQAIQAYRDKYHSRQMRFREINSQLEVRLQHSLEEIEKLKKSNLPSNQIQVIEQLNEKIKEVSNERNLFKQKCVEADHKASEMKKLINNLKHKVKKIDELQQDRNNKEAEEANKKLLYDLDQKKAKIMTLEANNASMLQEVKKLKELLSSKSAVTCKCASNARDSKSDSLQTYEDNNERKSKLDCRSDSDVASENQSAKQRSVDNIETPKQNCYPNEQVCTSCAGGGSGPANMVKAYYLEGVIRKKDKEISSLRAELTDLKSKIKNMKIRPLIREEKQPEVKKEKPEVAGTPMSPLQEVDENVTVQMKALHPSHGNAPPEIQRKHILKEKNGKSMKPYDKPQKMENIRKENGVPDWQFPASYYSANNRGKEKNIRTDKPEATEHLNWKYPSSSNQGPKSQYDAINHLADPECKQQ